MVERTICNKPGVPIFGGLIKDNFEKPPQKYTCMSAKGHRKLFCRSAGSGMGLSLHPSPLPSVTISNFRGIGGQSHRRQEGNGNPCQYSCLENPGKRGAWWATVHRVAKSWTRLSDFHSHFTHSQETDTPR